MASSPAGSSRRASRDRGDTPSTSNSTGAVLASRDANAPPLVADRIGFTGNVDFPNNLITIENAAIVTPVASIAATGSIGIGGPSPLFSVAATFSPMEADPLKQIWPSFIASGGRRWVLQHVTSGRIAAGRFDARLPVAFLFARKRPPISEDAMRLDLRLEDVEFTTYRRTAPGQACLWQRGPRRVDLRHRPRKGRSRDGFRPQGDGRQRLLRDRQRPAAQRRGRHRRPPFGRCRRLGRNRQREAVPRAPAPADRAAGPFRKRQAAISVRLPLKPGITESEVDWKVVVTATGVSSKAPVEGRIFSDANVTITVSPDAASVKGKAKIDGVVADVSISQPLGQGGAAAGAGRTDRPAHPRRRGAQAPRHRASTRSSAAPSVPRVSNIEDGSKGQHYDLDLRRARVNMPGLGWSKAIGVPATLTFDVKPAEGGYAVENIELGGAGFGFTGSAKLDSNYGLDLRRSRALRPAPGRLAEFPARPGRRAATPSSPRAPRSI